MILVMATGNDGVPAIKQWMARPSDIIRIDDALCFAHHRKFNGWLFKKSKLRHVVLSDLVERWKKPDAPRRGCRRAGNPTTEEEPTCPVGQRGFGARNIRPGPCRPRREKGQIASIVFIGDRSAGRHCADIHAECNNGTSGSFLRQARGT